jgi:hypothetical protein
MDEINDGADLPEEWQQETIQPQASQFTELVGDDEELPF